MLDAVCLRPSDGFGYAFLEGVFCHGVGTECSESAAAVEAAAQISPLPLLAALLQILGKSSVECCCTSRNSSPDLHVLEAMASDGEEKKAFSLQEVGQHVTLDDCWMVIHGKVYDVTKFMDDHPGGDDVLMQVAGKEASDEFDDVGHSKSAIEQLNDFYVGECPEVLVKKVASVPATDSKLGASDGPALTNSVGFFSKVLQFLVPLVLLGVAVALRKYGKRDDKN